MLTDGGPPMSVKSVPGMQNGVFQGDNFLPPAGYLSLLLKYIENRNMLTCVVGTLLVTCCTVHIVITRNVPVATHTLTRTILTGWGCLTVAG